jgi:predicted NUDIX family phosphoesterase
MSIVTAQQEIVQTHDESILVIKRELLFPHGPWHGLKQVDGDAYMHLIQTHQEFHPRSLMETDPRYKQIIPYLIFKHENSYFLMQRKAKASETRLQGKFTLGIGGHMRHEDMRGGTIFAWAQREFNEEIAYDGTCTMTFLGMLNDDSNAVGQVHIGLVLLLTGDGSNIAVKEELASGRLVSLEECKAHTAMLESWSQLVLEHLI